MNAITFLQTLRDLQKNVFAIKDISKLIQKPAEYVWVYLHRLKSKGYIIEVERNKYTLSKDPYEVGSNLVFPSYISFLSAYSLYGLTTQIPLNVQVVTIRPKKTLSYQGMKIKFITFQKQKIFGYSKQRFREKYFFLADKEKAIIDSLTFPEHCPISETFEALQSKELEIPKLVQYVLQMGSIVAVKRLGYLLEKTGIDVYSEVKNKLNPRYDSLNPLLGRSKNNSSKWKLNINEMLG